MSDTPSLPRIPRMCAATGCTKPSDGTRGGRCAAHTRAETTRHNERTAYYRTREWQQLRTERLRLDCQQCVICTSTTRLAVHHIVARRDGGPDRIDNLTTLCQRCHSRAEQGDESTLALVREHLEHRPA